MLLLSPLGLATSDFVLCAGLVLIRKEITEQGSDLLSRGAFRYLPPSTIFESNKAADRAGVLDNVHHLADDHAFLELTLGLSELGNERLDKYAKTSISGTVEELSLVAADNTVTGWLEVSRQRSLGLVDALGHTLALGGAVAAGNVAILVHLEEAIVKFQSRNVLHIDHGTNVESSKVHFLMLLIVHKVQLR